MQLALGLCYAVALANGKVVEFKFIGSQSGMVVAEVPPGGAQQDLLKLLQGGYTAYWQIQCP
jgi:hypothetical protein